MKLIKHKIGTPRYRAGLNRLNDQVLGVYVVINSWCYSLVWCKPTCRGKH